MSAIIIRWQEEGKQENFKSGIGTGTTAARKKKIISGTKTGDKFKTLRGNEPNRDIFIYRVHKDTKMADLQEFAVSEGFTVRKLTDVSDLSRWHTQSFILTVPVSQLEKALAPDSWPEGIYVRRHFSPRKLVDTIHQKVE